MSQTYLLMVVCSAAKRSGPYHIVYTINLILNKQSLCFFLLINICLGKANKASNKQAYKFSNQVETNNHFIFLFLFCFFII